MKNTDRYFVNCKSNGKMRHTEYKDFPKAKNSAVELAKLGMFESVHVLVAHFDGDGNLHQTVYNF